MEMPKEKPEINYPISEPCKDCESVFLPEQGQGSGPGLYKSKCKKGEYKQGTKISCFEQCLQLELIYIALLSPYT